MISRARRDGREARGNEERERIEKGSRERIEKRERENFFFFLDSALRCSHCFFKSSGYDKLEVKQSKCGFYKLIECIIKKICHGVKQNARICAIDENVMKLELFILGGLRIDQK